MDARAGEARSMEVVGPSIGEPGADAAPSPLAPGANLAVYEKVSLTP